MYHSATEMVSMAFYVIHLFSSFYIVTTVQALQDYRLWSRTSLAQPEFVGSIKNITVHMGKEAVLSCSVSNIGNYKVAWVREKDHTILSLQTRTVTHSSRISVIYDGLKTWELRIRHVKEDDRGCYMCEINTNVLKVQKGCIDVYVSPDIISEDTSGDVSAMEGENACLSCRASGRPTPRIIWKREDGKPIIFRSGPKEIEKVDIFNGSELNFFQLDRKQMGAYLCIASNDVPPAVSKRIILKVIFSPVIRVPSQLLGAPFGTSVRLECYVEAFPNTINYWVKDREEMLLNGTKYTVREEKYGYNVFMLLIIHSFFVDDIGTYNCVSTNSLGKAEGTIRLY
ncbi:lachesin-like, partial [Agrilus planipennis]|uniref:Lachesin-like n=1 Tax=Agrilus planipennis TaxID=224129 RepID=A0A1W4XLM5_AGRPL